MVINKFCKISFFKKAFMVLFSVLFITSCIKTRHNYTRMEINLFDLDGAETHEIKAIESGKSLSIGFNKLSPRAPVQVYLNDDLGKEWSYARLFADKKGNIKPVLFWYNTGVIGTTSRKIAFKPDPAFVTFEEAEKYFAVHPLTLTIKDLRGKIVGKKELPFKKNEKPFIYPSNSEGVLVNSFYAKKEDIYITGKNFPPDSKVQLMVVKNKYIWNMGDKIADVSGKGQSSEIETIELKPDQDNFIVKVWDKKIGEIGTYDLVARIGDDIGDMILKPSDILSYGDDTGMLLYVIINGNVVIESAGRMKSAPAKFEFADAFEKNEDIYAAVDPTDVPATHTGGNYAAYYVVEHQPASYWDGVNPVLTDVSGGIEIQRVKYWCINATRREVWANATQADPIKGYDLIVDFGSVPAMDAASFVADGIYNKGTDFIDGYSDVGFYVFEDPSTTGPYAVAQVELLEPNGISGITDPTGTTGPTESVTLAWARIMYPATTAGVGTPVSGILPNYPVALFLHGRHWNCDYDGDGPGMSGGYSFNCTPTDNYIPSHEGYNYIMERLASQGIFCISISAHDIQPGLGAWDYDARGRLILKFLDKLKDWNDNGTDPFGGIFSGKLDMSKVALSGHSRGGEGVVAAQEINQTWPTPHSIVAVNAIAPTDQNALSYLMTDAPYFLLIGARDGDVATMHGFRTYDRAYPEGAAVRYDKSVAWVYGANHNYFNTIWTDGAALGSPNPWAGAKDDGSTLSVSYSMLAAEQRQIAMTTICAFFRQHLQDIEPYREILTGKIKPSLLLNQEIYWTFQDEERKAIDNFEQVPLNKNQNTVTGAVTAPGFTLFDEYLLNYSSSDYPSGYPTDAKFFHDALGLKLGWSSPQTYTTNIPVGHQDVSMYTYLSFRAAKSVYGTPTSGTPVRLFVNIEDGTGNTGEWDQSTDLFDIIPHPYERSGGWCSSCYNQAQLTGVRIPLRNFTMCNSGVDLTNIVKITIRTEGASEIGIDDIEFTK